MSQDYGNYSPKNVYSPPTGGAAPVKGAEPSTAGDQSEKVGAAGGNSFKVKDSGGGVGSAMVRAWDKVGKALSELGSAFKELITGALGKTNIHISQSPPQNTPPSLELPREKPS